MVIVCVCEIMIVAHVKHFCCFSHLFYASLKWWKKGKRKENDRTKFPNVMVQEKTHPTQKKPGINICVWDFFMQMWGNVAWIYKCIWNSMKLIALKLKISFSHIKHSPQVSAESLRKFRPQNSQCEFALAGKIHGISLNQDKNNKIKNKVKIVKLVDLLAVQCSVLDSLYLFEGIFDICWSCVPGLDYKQIKKGRFVVNFLSMSGFFGMIDRRILPHNINIFEIDTTHWPLTNDCNSIHLFFSLNRRYNQIFDHLVVHLNKIGTEHLAHIFLRQNYNLDDVIANVSTR